MPQSVLPVPARVLTGAGETLQSHSASRDSRPPASFFDLAAVFLLAVAAVALWISSPREGDFWYSDTSRHAMDGVFLHDLIRNAPLHDLQSHATAYYMRYPALTILFYPPLFPAFEALFFALFDVSHATAQLTVAFFYCLAMWGVFALCRQWMDTAQSFAAALLFAGFPEVALWGRQVMLELPAIAFIVWAAYFLVRYLEMKRPALLYVVVLMLLGGIYTKQTVAWFAVPCVWAIYTHQKNLTVRNVYWRGVILFLTGLAPLALLTWKFGLFNFHVSVRGDNSMIPIVSWQSISYYLKQLPHQTGWVPVVLAAAYVIELVRRRTLLNQRNGLLILWFAVGYVFFTLIALKDARHTTVMLIPVAILAVQGLARLLPGRAASTAAIVLAVAVFAHAQLREPVPSVGGYRQAVDYAADRAPKDTTILFSGLRDGSVVFNLRARGDRPDLAVLRSDKLLLRVANGQKFAAHELDVKQEEIGELLNRYRVSYVISQPNFWDDLGAMQRLQAVLHSKQFRKIATVPVEGNVNHEDSELEIYENLGPLATGSNEIRMELPMVGVVIEGRFGSGSAAVKSNAENSAGK